MPKLASLVPDLLRQAAAEEAGRVAMMTDGGPPLTYRAWDARSNALARGLVDRGVRAGDRVGLFFDNTAWTSYAVAYMGTAKAGAIAVPLSSRFPDREVIALVERCGATAVVGEDPACRTAAWTATVDELETGQDSGDFQVPVDAGDLAEVLYTSGTTGTPKGVACSHEQIVRPLAQQDGWPPEPWRASSRGVYLHANSVSTAAGQLRLLEPLRPQRMTTLAQPVFDTDRFCSLIAEHQVAVVQLVPGMARAILDVEAHRRFDLSSVRVVVFGCAPMPPATLPELAACFPNSILVNMYELTEARHAGTHMVYDGTRADSVGVPTPPTVVRIVDEAGHEMARGEVGEVCLRLPGMPPQHYFEDPDATAAVFTDGWTRTGDVGYLDDDGYLYLVDRIKDVIIQGGLKISSVEVEAVLQEHPAVVEAAVVGLPHQVQGEEVTAAVVLRSPVPGRTLREFVAERLAPHKVPARIAVVDAIPRNASGKPLKRRLRAQLSRGRAPSTGPGDGNRVWQKVYAIWAEVLGDDDIDPDASLLELGGNSLAATQIIARVRRAFRLELSVGDVLEGRTLNQLVALVEEATSGAGRRAAPPPTIPRLPRQPVT